MTAIIINQNSEILKIDKMSEKEKMVQVLEVQGHGD